MSFFNKPRTIFVSVASYRDDVCNSTLQSLFSMADKPENVFVGICQQNKKGDDECNKGFEDSPNVRIIRIPYYEAKGPTYARYLCSTLLGNEEFFLQIDSHSKLVKGWDTLCMQMIQEIKDKKLSKKPVLSHYPKEIESYESETDQSKWVVPRICKSFFNKRGMISFMGSQNLNTQQEYYNTPYVSGGMVFCESKFVNEMPFDPNLPYLFTGEEILQSVRFYTNGWDVFTPNQNIVYHEYTRANKPKIWTDNPTYSDMDAFNKVKQYLHLINEDVKQLPESVTVNMDKYGLGTTRTLESYWKFAGIDTANQIVSTNFCQLNNVATKEDIEKSSENRWTEKEGFTTYSTFNDEYPYIQRIKHGNNTFLLFFLFLLLVGIVFLLSKKRFRIKLNSK